MIRFCKHCGKSEFYLNAVREMEQKNGRIYNIPADECPPSPTKAHVLTGAI